MKRLLVFSFRKYEVEQRYKNCKITDIESPFKTISADRKRLFCLTASFIGAEYEEATKNINTSVHINGNKHLYSWLTKPVEIPEDSTDWAMSLKVFTREHSN